MKATTIYRVSATASRPRALTCSIPIRHSTRKPPATSAYWGKAVVIGCVAEPPLVANSSLANNRCHCAVRSETKYSETLHRPRS